MSTDDELVRRLREHARAVVPPLAVDTAAVVPRARRRRATTRAAGAAAVGLVAVAGIVVGQAWADAPWRAGPGEIAPATRSTAPAAPTPTPEDTSHGADARPGTAQGAAPYWYTVSTGPGGSGERDEKWQSPSRPGLLVTDGDLAHATATGPDRLSGPFRIGGAWVDVLDDPTRLPTDPAALEAVLRDSIEPDRRAGTDDDKVYGMVYDLLIESPGWLPTDLLRAAWQVAGSLPGSTLEPGEDSTGRAGEVLTRPGGVNGAERLVVDPATGLVLELEQEGQVRVFQQGPADAVPVEPSLEATGCTSWESC